MSRPIDALCKLIEAAYKIANLKRFPSHRVHQIQSPAQHSFNVAMLCLIIAVRDNAKIDLGKLLAKAISHDLLEAYTSDIPAPVKHYDKHITNAIRGVERAILSTLLLDMPQASQWKEWIGGCKKGVEGAIVDLADLLERCIYLEHEFRSGNTLPADMYDGTLKQLKTARYKRLFKKYPTAQGIFNAYSEHLKGKTNG